MPSRIAPITKERFLAALTCPTQAWYLAREDALPSIGDLFRMEEGQEIHALARDKYPRGRFAGSPEQTARLLKDASTKVVLEAAFHVDGYAARVDILRKGEGGLVVTEVKSSLHDDDRVDDEHLDDLAYTVMVLRRAGQVVGRVTLLQVSRDYRRGRRLPMFVESDHTRAAFERADEFNNRWAGVRRAVRGTKRPTPILCLACRNCAFFERRCLGTRIRHPVFELPGLREKRFGALLKAGCRTIRDIPSDFDLTDNQHRVRRAVVRNAPEVDKSGLRRLLKQVRWPAAYLDFETMKLALPLWPRIAPHEQVLTQYSIHICSVPGKVVRHHEYLAESSRDCRIELVLSLLRDLKGTRSIVVYSQFEKAMLENMAKRFPKLARPLRGCIKRILDLERVFREHFYHPEFRGRTSIKRTLPVLVPDMSYDGLSIADGDTALTLFGRMARGEIASLEAEVVRADLLRYCRQDTLAMVRLHAALHKNCR